MKAIDFLIDYFNEDDNFIIAQKHPMVDEKIKHHHTMLSTSNKNLNKQLGRFYYMNKDDDVDIYFSLNTYMMQKSFYPSRKEEFVNSIKSFYFDIDKGNIEQKKSDIINIFGYPTYIIESSKNKFQFIYKFIEPYIVNNEEDRVEFKQLLKGLTYHFDIDKTFDTARIFRLVGYMNKKPNNDDFIVTIKKFDNYYIYSDFQEIAKYYLLKEPKPKTSVQKGTETVQKTKKSKNMSISSHHSKFDEFKGIKKIINRKYKELFNKYSNDNSTADIAYVKWLRHAKQITNEDELILKLFQARGYDNIMQKHGYQIDYYISNILKKT